MTPYVYLIGWTEQNKWYYGVRYARGCHPEDLLNPYISSSKYVKRFVKENGMPDVKQIRRTFKSIDAARNWEHKVLKRMGVIRKDEWLNKTDNKSISPDFEYGWSESAKKKASKTHTGMKHTEETKAKIGAVHKGKIVSEETRKKIGLNSLGKKYFLGRKHSEEAKQKMSRTKQAKKLERMSNNASI